MAITHQVSNHGPFIKVKDNVKNKLNNQFVATFFFNTQRMAENLCTEGPGGPADPGASNRYMAVILEYDKLRNKTAGKNPYPGSAGFPLVPRGLSVDYRLLSVNSMPLLRSKGFKTPGV